jgi:hypothetical protein
MFPWRLGCCHSLSGAGGGCHSFVSFISFLFVILVIIILVVLVLLLFCFVPMGQLPSFRCYNPVGNAGLLIIPTQVDSSIA